MKILNAEQTHLVDAYTIANEPIKSIDLMERASFACSSWILTSFSKNQHFYVFCGMGNNGGDGLAIARQLYDAGKEVTCYIVPFSSAGSTDFETNKQRLIDLKIDLTYLTNKEQLQTLQKNSLIIDAIFGSGLSKAPQGIAADVIDEINKSSLTKISIDISSGLYCTDNSNNNYHNVVQADYTLALHLPKLAQLLPSNHPYVGNLQVLPIGLNNEIIDNIESPHRLTTINVARQILKSRSKFSHKGNYGHTCIIAGSLGKMGAAVLAVKAALRAGSGLVSARIPKCGIDIMQTSVPEAMVLANQGQDELKYSINHGKFTIGIGPGIGISKHTSDFLEALLDKANLPLVLDADALNIIADNPEFIKLIPIQSILTPHPKEFERIVGMWDNDNQKLELLTNLSKKSNSIIVLKGAHTVIACEGKLHFNNTGNPGMAAAGSGDCLTGILTALLSQGYEPLEAAMLGVFLHGLAGDIAKTKQSEESLIASDIIDNLGEAYNYLRT